MISPFSNPSYLIPPLIVFIASLILLGIVIRRASKSFRRTIFCLLIVSVALSGLLVFGMRSSPDIYQALPWDRAAFVSAYAIFVLFYHFTLAYTNSRGTRRTLYFAYVLLIVASVLGPSSLIVERMVIEDYGYAPVSGPLAVALAAVMIFLAVRGIINLVKYYRAFLSYGERNRSLYLIVATIILIVGALLDGFSSLPPVAIWTALTFCIISSIAILRYHLLDIRVIARRGLAYLLVSIIIAAPYVIALFVLNRVLHTRIEQWWQYVLIILPVSYTHLRAHET